MQIIHLDLTNLPTLPPLALTIGNFDGVHLGHQAMLTRTLDVARDVPNDAPLKSAVMIFEPQPKEFFDPANAPARLTTLDEKTRYITELGIDFLLVARFDTAFASLSPDEFCELLTKLNIQRLVLGDDFRFGKKRAGDISLLKQYFEVFQLDSVLVDGKRVSSTLVRTALATGNLALAKTLLGRDYAITGQVVHGDKIGRTLDFPTANIALNRIRPAPQGIFGVAVYGIDFKADFNDKRGIILADGALFGCANLGTRPSVDGDDYRLEVHLPDFDGDLYGKIVTVKFLHFLHSERDYPSLDALKSGIKDDVNALLTWQKIHLVPHSNVIS